MSVMPREAGLTSKTVFFAEQTVLRMVGLGRVELPTRGLGNRCSIHLSYSPTEHPVYRKPVPISPLDEFNVLPNLVHPS
jgi:hypothetical protein